MKFKHHKDWDADSGLFTPVLGLCFELGATVKDLLGGAGKRAGRQVQISELQRIDRVLDEVQSTRTVTECHVEELKVAVSGLSIAFQAGGGGGGYEEIRELLNALLLAIEDETSPLASYLLIGKLAGSKVFTGQQWEEEIDGEPSLELLFGDSRYKDFQKRGQTFGKSMKAVQDAAYEAAESSIRCAELSLRERHYHAVGVAIIAAERKYEELLCEAEWVSRIQVTDCVDYLSRRFTRAGMYLEHSRYWYNKISVGDCCDSRAHGALRSLKKWSAGLAREVRAYAKGRACALVGTLPAMTVDFERDVKEFVSAAERGYDTPGAIVTNLDALHERLGKIDICAHDLHLDHFPSHAIRRGYVEINRTRLAFAGCGCQDGWRDAAEALEVIISSVYEWQDVRKRVAANPDEIPASEEFVELLCQVLPAARTVWCAISESWHQGTCGHGGHKHSPGRPYGYDDRHDPPHHGQADPGLKWPKIPEKEPRPLGPDEPYVYPTPYVYPPPHEHPPRDRVNFGEIDGFKNRLDVVKTRLGEKATGELQRKLELLTVLRNDPGSLNIPRAQAGPALRVAADAFNAELAALELMQSGKVGRSIKTVLPGRHYVDLGLLPSGSKVIVES